MAAATYSCQRCRQPLTIQHGAHLPAALESRLSVKESQYDLLASHISVAGYGAAGSTSSTNSGVAEPRASTTSRSDDPDPALRAIAAIPLLPRKPVSVPPGLLAKVPEHQKLFDLLSSTSEIDHPVCTECADWWFAKMRKTLEEHKNQREVLLQFEKEARARQAQLTPDRIAAIKDDLQRLQGEERQLVEQLLEAEKQKGDIERDMKELDEEEKQLEAEEAE